MPQEIQEEILVSKDEAIGDYRLLYQSREASILGRREVLTGKAKFGIFGDGKELPQLAMAKIFKPGDIRSGYYRDQTLIFATKQATIKEFFAQLYANPEGNLDPFSSGRQMNGHFGTAHLDEAGHWLDLTKKALSASDSSPTASQMPRLTGLAQASKLYRQLPELASMTGFSNQGNEVAFGTIGNASCAEGHFWETLNAIGVIQAPLIMSIWDDGFGISVPNEFQLTRDLSDMISGLQRSEGTRGYEIFRVKGWDYEALIQTYREANFWAREKHVPCIIHVVEVTQPQGHSTSGSHERYKSPERLAWEKDYDCLGLLRQFLINKGFATEEEISAWEKEDKKMVRNEKNEAWREFQEPILAQKNELTAILDNLPGEVINDIKFRLKRDPAPSRRLLLRSGHDAMLACWGLESPELDDLRQWLEEKKNHGQNLFSSHLYSQSDESPMLVQPIEAVYAQDPEVLSGFEILNRNFEALLRRDPRVLAFGEDVGHLGDVNQGFAGLQEKFGKLRVIDTGIREATIVGQAIGLAMRGLRPIAEIQYLDYFLYGLQTLSDDLATLHYRSHGRQKAPAIIRTRGHRLEGIWHAGSPLGMMIHALRGMHIAVPRNMVQAVGFYNTLMKGDDPAVVIEVLNGYRLKERVPSNLTEFCLPLGVPEVIREGTDITLVTYGACCRIATEAATQLESCGISVEIVDVQTLLPFDIHHKILDSLKKTNRILFLDEDVPGGSTSYMYQQVMEVQGGYFWLDSPAQTLSAKPHRTAFGDDGDYFSKPQAEDIFKAVYAIMNEVDPESYPSWM
ncbi:MAG: thiamine pyrophosphate-dependent enzyme [Bacteroidia bacterium]|nr:thiamine pyrophosphate-dependent enzyme [Bacteroidia bacterium]